MTDETTARDRAIEMDVDEALELAERVSAPGSAGQSLAAEVRRLRALAGAPTADVAEAPTSSAAQTEFLLSSAIGHAEQPGVLPTGVVGPIQHLLRNVMYYRSELAGSWIDAAGELAEEILSIDPAAPEGAPTADVASAEWYCEAGCEDVMFDVNVQATHEVCGSEVGYRIVRPTAPAAVAAMEETIEILSDPDTMDAIREGQMVDAATGVDLRALLVVAPEGVPTADVASLRKRIADTLHMGLDDATPNDVMGDAEDHARWVGRVQEWADWIHEQYAPLLAAAPEGVDAAAVPPLEAEWNVIELGTIRASLDRAGIPDRRVGAAVRVDEALGELEQLRAAAPEGVDQEAQGGMADELTAAQAAIQRVQSECDQTEKRAREMVGIFSGKKGADVPPWVGRIRRALDGDTTEEA